MTANAGIGDTRLIAIDLATPDEGSKSVRQSASDLEDSATRKGSIPISAFPGIFGAATAPSISG